MILQQIIKQIFTEVKSIELEFLINKEIEKTNSDEFIANQVMEFYILPTLHIVGAHGEEGEIYGYFDFKYDPNLNRISDAKYISPEIARDLLSKYYDTSTFYCL